MPVLSNPKWEQFANSIADGLKQIDAYEFAGYNRSPTAASQLRNRPEIQSRIQELIAEKAKAREESGEEDPDPLPSDLNRTWLITTLMRNVRIAQNAGQISAANKAVELLAEMIGWNPKKGKSKTADGEEVEDDDVAEEEVDIDKFSDALKHLHEVLPEKDAKEK